MQRILFLLAMLWGLALPGFAQPTLPTQIGAEMYHEQIGPNLYRIYHIQYTACFDSIYGWITEPEPLFVAQSLAGTATGLQAMDTMTSDTTYVIRRYCGPARSSCGIWSNDVRAFRYYQDWQVPAGSTVKFSASLCCIFDSLIIGGGGTYAYTTVISGYGSGPRFVAEPATVLLTGSSTTMSVYQGAQDPDGDSVAYTLSDFLVDSQGVVLNVPSLGNVTAIDANGLLLFNVSSLWWEEKVGLVARTYHNGVLSGESYRSYLTYLFWQPGLSSFTLNPLVSLNTATQIVGNQVSIGALNTMSLAVSATLSNGQITRADSALMAFWPPGMTATVAGSGTAAATQTLTWTPALADTGVYWVPVAFVADFCPYFQHTTSVIRIEVKEPLVTIASAAIVPAICGQTNGAITPTIVGGTAPYSFAWNNGATSSALTGIGVGSYTLTVTDASGDTDTRTFLVQASNLITTLVPAWTCAGGVNSGSIAATTAGGTAPYGYAVSLLGGGPVAGLTGLAEGEYLVQTTDAAGCIVLDSVQVVKPAGCKIVISGQVYADYNGNCTKETGEPPIGGVFVSSNQGQGALANFQGYYSFEVGPGTHQVSYSPAPTAASCVPVTVAAATYGVNHPNTNLGGPPTWSADLEVSHVWDNVRPGSTALGNVWLKNDAPVSRINVPVTLELPAMLTNFSSSVAPATYNPATQIVTWVIPVLPPGQVPIFIQGLIPTSTAIGTPWQSVATIGFDSLPETDSLNNTNVWAGVVTTAYDPNDKVVQPTGKSAAGYVPQAQKDFSYTIRFQNTGNDTAFLVVIRDTLSALLDPATFEFVGSSHPCEVSMADGHLLTFRFEHILLPDSNTNLLQSQGFVQYTIRAKENLLQGDEILNRAGIYFDFNEVVLTNTVVNTICNDVVNGVNLQISEPLTIFFTDTSVWATGYAYSFGDGTTGLGFPPNHTYADTGTYTVEVIALNACSSDTLTTTVVLTNTDLAHSMAAGWWVSPNPMRESTVVYLPANQRVELSVFDLSGKLLRHYPAASGAVEIRREGLMPGLYLLRADGLPGGSLLRVE